MIDRHDIRLGLIGAGPWGRNYIRTIGSLDGAQLTRLATRNPASRDLVDADCLISERWQDVLEFGDLDGLIVATPPAVQYEIACAAIRAGLPLMLEKPVALEVLHVQKMLDLAAEKAVPVPVLVDHIYLFHPAYHALKNEAEKLGGVIAIESRGGKRGPFRAGMRPLWDWAPHDVAMCIDLADAAPARVTATMVHAERVPEGEGEVIQLDLEFPSRVSATITVGNLLETPSRYFCAFCEQGELIFDDLAADTLIRRTKSGETALSVHDSLPLNNAVEKFMRCIAGENYPAFGLERALEVTQTIAAAEQQLAPVMQTS